MWKEKFDELIKEKELYGEDVNIGATKECIVLLAKSAREETDIDLPAEYIELLEKINGLEFNGFIFYGVDERFLTDIPAQHITGILEANQIWYENEQQKEYLFIGESNISWYVYKKKTQEYLELDNPSGRILIKYNNLEEMFKQFLSDALL